MPKYDEFVSTNNNREDDDSIVLESIVLSIDEYEAIRLIDNENLSQEECSKQMNVARTTIQQIYTNARKKIAKALINGNRLLIQGGDYTLCDGNHNNCHHNACKKRRCQAQANIENTKE